MPPVRAESDHRDRQLFGSILEGTDDLTDLDEDIEKRSIQRDGASDRDGYGHCGQGASGTRHFAVPAPDCHQSRAHRYFGTAPV